MKATALVALMRCAIALVWLGNGLFAKVLGFVPRHEDIVARILGSSHAHSLTVAIGLTEVVMFAWVLTGWRVRLNAVLQMIVVMAMNVLEFFLARDLLLCGGLNIVFASGFVGVVYWYAFRLYANAAEN